MTPAELLAGRLRKQPQRDSQQYARLMSIGGWGGADKRAMIKPTPANLRQFARTPYARRAINRIKQPIVNLEWEIVATKGIKVNAALQSQIDVATGCLKSPNSDDSLRTFLEQLIEDACICGAGAYEHQIGSDPNRPLWLWPVDALSIQVYPAWDGGKSSPRYMQTIGYSNVASVQGRPLTNDELVYMRIDPTTQGPFGLGPLEVAFMTISRKLGVAQYAGDLASNAQPENMLIVAGMDEPALRALRGYWRNEVEGQGQTPILGPPSGGEVSVEKLRGTDDKALFIEWQKFLIREIFVPFGLSPMNGGLDMPNRSVAEVSDDQDWANAIMPMATNICAHITRETIQRRLGFSSLEFRFIGLDREDELNMAKVFEVEYRNCASTPNEYRARMRKQPLDNPFGDMLAADVAIATAAARGAAVVDDAALDSPVTPKPAKPASSRKDK